jgi:uncharacterized membrane protein YvbJ
MKEPQYCTSCGEAIKKAAEVCPKCGVRLKDLPSTYEDNKRAELIGCHHGCLLIIVFIAVIAIILTVIIALL